MSIYYNVFFELILCSADFTSKHYTLCVYITNEGKSQRKQWVRRVVEIKDASGGSKKRRGWTSFECCYSLEVSRWLTHTYTPPDVPTLSTLPPIYTIEYQCKSLRSFISFFPLLLTFHYFKNFFKSVYFPPCHLECFRFTVAHIQMCQKTD